MDSIAAAKQAHQLLLIAAVIIGIAGLIMLFVESSEQRIQILIVPAAISCVLVITALGISQKYKR